MAQVEGWSLGGARCLAKVLPSVFKAEHESLEECKKFEAEFARSEATRRAAARRVPSGVQLACCSLFILTFDC